MYATMPLKALALLDREVPMTPISCSRSASRHQRGATTLVVALVLLFGMTLVTFYANRGQIFEQRTSANQYRSTRAFEMAEAGLEWAAARLTVQRVVYTANGIRSARVLGKNAVHLPAT